jgi:hypothetical protein
MKVTNDDRKTIDVRATYQQISITTNYRVHVSVDIVGFCIPTQYLYVLLYREFVSQCCNDISDKTSFSGSFISVQIVK